MECEITQINNMSILDEDVPYSIVVKNITAKGYVQSVCKRFFCFFFDVLYIQFAVSEKASSNIFLLIQKQSLELLCEKRYS